MAPTKRRKLADGAATDLSPELVTQYLRKNPNVLDQIVSSDLVHTDRLKEWLHRKSKQNNDQAQSQGQNNVQEPRELSPLPGANHSATRLLHLPQTRLAVENGDHSSDSSLVLSKWKTKIQMSKKKILHELSKEFHHINGKVRVLLELADCVAAAVSADSFTLHSCDVSRQELTHLLKNEDGEVEFGNKESVGPKISVAATAAHTKEAVRLKDLLVSQGSANGLSVSSTRAHSVMALPVLDDQNNCFGVVELHRHSEHSHFTDEEEEVGLLMLQWFDMLLDYVEIACLVLAIAVIALVKAETHSTMMRQRTLSDFLLEVTKSIFQDIVSMDVVIMKIMNFAKALVQADRTALFLLDTRSNELYARIFDDGYSLEEFSSPMEAKVRAMDASDSEGSGGRRDRKLKSESGEGKEDNSQVHTDSSGEDKKDTEKKRRAEWYSDDIRFSMEKGVAGYVASTGKILNIVDAYKDKRFNPEVDIRTGYKTKTILCMPIFIRGNVIGVVQMVNKLQGTFTKKDEEAFATFAIYCGLALHHAKLYEKIRRSEQKYKVALDVLSYHSQALPEEVQTLRARPLPDHIPEISTYHFSPWAVMEDDKPLQCLFMFRSLFENIKYDMDDLVRFTLTVRKNYRNVPYHNWTHAFSVAHSMFVVIHTAKHRLSPIESISLFVACLCHDLDHRGKTNQFMVQSASPLAAIYSTSTMEHHHFNQTVTILQNEGHNIFKYLSSDDYKQVLSDIKQSILATDLAVFFKNKSELNNILQTNQGFNWDVLHHRNVLTAVTMTACDLCAMFKPWDVQHKLVYVIMEEFWQQGDEERKRGITPVEMMDRNKKDELPNLEVGFIQSICVPCYELMFQVMPDTKPMLDGARANLQRWKSMADELESQRGRNGESPEATKSV
ncbi:hypothetical protein RRG08_037415 [Elysia crispata]|uniref:Phosphodiesterase n=1 Tax=Elysia crispata TaxID=231223 RepID=A0AAE1AFH5_9GAST|nr:hypothetical protein RRG08_037415 [Elysia crispata]